MFGRRRRAPVGSYDREALEPVIRGSICTGEQVIGFRERATGRFINAEAIRTEAEKRDFMRRYGIDEADVRKEW